MDLPELLTRLSAAYDVEGWWPAESPFEVMVGAILTQQTIWENVTPVLASMRREGLLQVDGLADCDLDRLEQLVRPSGFYRQKAKRLKHVAMHVRDKHGSDAGEFLNGDLTEVRNELLSLPGIGKETADSILLFGGGRPKFVAAVYVSRTLSRTGILSAEDYDEVQTFVESAIAPDAATYRRLYALCVHLCKTCCKKRPNCLSCPLEENCPSAVRT